MFERRQWCRASLAGALLSLLANVTPAAAQAVAVRVTLPGGGIARPFRWLPLTVTIDSQRAELTGELRVWWGDARLVRRINLPSAGTRAFDLYLRTGEPEAVARVVLTSGGRELQTISVPLQVVGPAAPAILCVRSPDGASAAAGCTATASAENLPRSPRGFEPLDDVALPRSIHSLPPEQSRALQQWRALRRIETSGDLGLAPQPVRPPVRRGLPDRAARGIALGAAGYVLCLGLAALLLRYFRAPALLLWTGVAGVVLTATATTFALARSGPGEKIRVVHSSLVEQIPGAPGSLVTMRGVVEFPAFDTYEVQWDLPDGVVEPLTASGRMEQAVGDNGLPVVAGTYGLGARQPFEAEGIVDLQPLDVRIDGASVTITNVLDRSLEGCRFGDGVSGSHTGALAAGQSVSAVRTRGAHGPIVTCTMEESPIRLSAGIWAIIADGTTTIAAFGAADARAEPADD